MPDVQAEREREQRDRERERIRLDAARLCEGVSSASRELHLGITWNDDHLVISGLRRLVALGAMAKPKADELEGLLPQLSRLFNPVDLPSLPTS